MRQVRQNTIHTGCGGGSACAVRTRESRQPTATRRTRDADARRRRTVAHRQRHRTVDWTAQFPQYFVVVQVARARSRLAPRLHATNSYQRSQSATRRLLVRTLRHTSAQAQALAQRCLIPMRRETWPPAVRKCPAARSNWSGSARAVGSRGFGRAASCSRRGCCSQTRSCRATAAA